MDLADLAVARENLAVANAVRRDGEVKRFPEPAFRESEKKHEVVLPVGQRSSVNGDLTHRGRDVYRGNQAELPFRVQAAALQIAYGPVGCKRSMV
jgi:hypothetical protein